MAPLRSSHRNDMINNDVLRSIRYMLDLSDGKVVELIHRADASAPVAKEDVQAFLKKDGEPGYAECSNRTLALFLDGLVFHCRGKDDSRAPRPPEKRVTNNVVLKKLRVAFELKDVDMHEILEAAGFPISKPDANNQIPATARFPISHPDHSALVRQRNNKNHKLYGDHLMPNCLQGLP